MSASYEAQFTVFCQPDEAEKVKEAIEKHWPVDTFDTPKVERGDQFSYFAGERSGGDPEESKDNAVCAIYDALGRTVKVDVTVFYLDQCPNESWSYGPNLEDGDDLDYPFPE